MKRMLGGVIVAVLILAVLAGIWIFDRPDANSPQDSPVSAADGRMLGVWEERLALFENGNALPKEVYDVWIATLPDTEQQRLQAGIPITDDGMLAGLLEDYTG